LEPPENPGRFNKPKIVVIHVGFNSEDHEFRYTVKAVR